MSELGDSLQRLQSELMLLEATYPDEIIYNAHAGELKFTVITRSSLTLRLPQDYPGSSLPEVLAACDAEKRDLREELRKRVRVLPLGEEVLDMIIEAFLEAVDSASIKETSGPSEASKQGQEPPSQESLTVIIWLHHLLATSKRKLAIAPSSTISGITKPGYPGVMLFTGPAAAVREHVETLKHENWQAFQIRFEENEIWTLAHGKGIKEIETMGDVVKDVGATKKEMFLEVMKIK